MSERIYEPRARWTLCTSDSGATLMDFIWRRLRTFGVMVLLFIATGTAIAVAHPHAFFNPGLGAEWQCSRTLIVVTCSHSTKS